MKKMIASLLAAAFLTVGSSAIAATPKAVKSVKPAAHSKMVAKAKVKHVVKKTDAMKKPMAKKPMMKKPMAKKPMMKKTAPKK